MMRDAIINFHKQFRFRPKIEGGKVKKYKKFLACGMGGSAQPAEVLKSLVPDLNIFIHKDYGLPAGEWKKTLVLAVSYSGNTEETVSSLQEAISKQLPCLAIATGGKLIEIAKAENVPYILIPATGIQPRSATGFLFMALLKALKLKKQLSAARELFKKLQAKQLEQAGKALAEKLYGRVPIIYTSARNFPLAYMWKIKFNETGKIPAFYNILPELNHNEMTGFDVKDTSRALSRLFHFVFLKDQKDHPQVQKRFEVLEKLYQDRNLPVESIWINIPNQNRIFNFFYTLLLGDWAALYTAESYGLESEQVPMVEEFKRLIK